MDNQDIKSLQVDITNLTANPNASLEDLKPILTRVEKLTPEQIQKIAQDASQLKDLTDDQRHAAELKIIQFLSSKVGIEIVMYAAKNAGANVKKIDEAFSELLAQLASIDNKYQTKFVVDFQGFMRDYQTVVLDSKLLATDISTYGKNFHKIIKPVINSTEISLEEKKDVLNGFIAQATRFEDQAKTTDTKMKDLLARFMVFTQNFKDWGKPAHEELLKKIQNLEKEVADLSARVSAIRRQVQDDANIGVGVGITLGFLGMFFPPALPAMLVLGTVSVGIGAIVGLAHMVEANDVDKQRKSKLAELEKVQAEEKEFGAARAKLSQLADQDLAIFKTGINLLDDVWKNAALDAREILSTLNTGEAAARSNFAVRLALDEANTMYMVMGQYLDEYARGLEVVARKAQ